MIKLDEKWSITGETYNWTLLFEEKRDREKPAKDGSTTYIFSDQWYFSNIKQALNKYVNEATKAVKSVEGVLEKLNSIETTIKTLKL